MANAKNASASKPKIGGAAHRGVIGTALPTDAITALNEALKSLGYISEDGLTNSTAIETGTIKAWGGDIVESYQSEKKDTFKFVLIESLNVEVLKTVHGDSNATGDLEKGIVVHVKPEELTASSWVFDMILKGGMLKRIVVPEAKITEIGDVVYKDDNLIAYEVTITAFPDENGDYHREYIQKKGAAS